jgi:Tfp pilus assembly protein PilO
MELDDLVDKYRGAKKQVRFGLVALVGLLPALNMWLNEGEALEARKQQVESEVAEERNKFEAARQKVAELPALLAKLTEIEDDLAKAKQILPDRIEVDTILSALGNLEKELGVKIVKFTPGQETQPNPQLEYKEIPIDLVLRAPFPHTMRFLDRLVHMPNLTHIRNIQFGELAETDEASKEQIGESPILESNAMLILFRGI